MLLIKGIEVSDNHVAAKRVGLSSNDTLNTYN